MVLRCCNSEKLLPAVRSVVLKKEVWERTQKLAIFK